jgi:lipopolysaccharide transport system ATP-binding protein
MSNTVISVENLSKVYRLGQIGTGTFSRDLNMWWAKFRGKPNPMLRIGETDHGNRDNKDLWALKDVSFKVKQGEVLGIIGRNGAGKSTLLKILSRVTAPTSGKIKVKGRVASLLEVGTGFHPELTGRENIYLNGAILGMNRREIDRKFDEIVDFAEIEKFIDTPVKRYSSGMYVRLAFAVAAHLESEILLVDEVLAVGDAEFQKKCLGKMGDVSMKEGRTVLFVSHNMAAVTMLCGSSLLINQGSIQAVGKTSEIIRAYTGLNKTPAEPHTEFGLGEFSNIKYDPESPISNSEITVTVDLFINHPLTDYNLFFIIQDDSSNILVHSAISGKQISKELQRGLYKIKIALPPLWLKPGNYSMFFKIVTLGRYNSRIVSQTIPVEIVYYVDNINLPGLINPSVLWSFSDEKGIQKNIKKDNCYDI